MQAYSGESIIMWQPMNTFISPWLHVRSYLRFLMKKKTSSIGSGFTPALFMKNRYHKRIECTARYEITGHLSEDQASVKKTGWELMSVAWRGRSDISSPTVSHSVLTMMYGLGMAPVTQQNRSISPCWGALQWDNRRLWPLLWNDKTPWGGG